MEAGGLAIYLPRRDKRGNVRFGDDLYTMPGMRTRATVPLSRFGQLLTEICDRKGLKLLDVGGRAGIKGRGRMTYAIRPHCDTRRTLLTVPQLRALAQACGATQDEQFRLVILGCLEHAPPVLADYVIGLEEENANLRKKTHTPVTRHHLVDA